MATKTRYYAFGGGLDVVTPALSVHPGRAIAMVNYEPWFNGGYRRIPGFERFDGRPKPSDATFTGFVLNDITGLVVGDTVTGSLSSTTGVICGIDTTTKAVGVTKIVGTGFVINDVLTGPTPTTFLRPDANATGDTSNLLTNNFSLINEAVATPNGQVNDSIDDAWSGGAPPKVTWTMTNMPLASAGLNSWILRTRAIVDRSGGETDDTVTYTYRATIGAEIETTAYTDVDDGGGFIDRTSTEPASAEVKADADAAIIELEQTAFAQTAALDGLSIDTDAIEIEVNYDYSGTITSTPGSESAPTQALIDTFLLGAQNEYRTDILVVPGSGQVLGVWQRDAVVLAVRDNVGDTAGILHQSSSSGWTTVGITMGDYIFFTGGGGGSARALPVEGDTIAGAVSGATATVHRVIVHSGTTAANDAAGYVVVTGVTGGPFQAEALNESATKWADGTAAETTFAFSKDGEYRFINHNFSGGSATYRTYGVNNVDPAFEIDENLIVSPILFPATVATGQPSTNLPFLIEEHRGHLFLAMPGGRFIHSVIGEPLNFNGFLGAAEFGLGNDITGMNTITGGVLVVSTERDTHGLFGTNVSDWELRLLGEQTGAKLYTAQKIDTVYGLDDLGITSLSRTQSFGDFVGSTVSQLIQPVVQTLRNAVTASTIVRTSNQYRVYFTNNEALIMYVPNTGGSNVSRGTQTRTLVEFGFLSYPFAVRRIYNSEDQTGLETTYFASDDGYAYQDQIGRNFDGAKIESYIRTAFNHLKSPSYLKRFRRADLELSATKPLALKFVHDLSYGSAEVSSGITNITTSDISQINVFAGGGFWDDTNWDEFFWDGQNISTARGELNGTGENISLLIFNEEFEAEPYIIQGITLHYDLRRLQR